MIDRADKCAQEREMLRAALLFHPAVETLRFLAPFIRDAVMADTWKAGPGTQAVERELESALLWLKRLESTDCEEVCMERCRGACGVLPDEPTTGELLRTKGTR